MTEQKDGDPSGHIVIASKSLSNKALEELGGKLKVADESARKQPGTAESTSEPASGATERVKPPLIDSEGAAVLARTLKEAVVGAVAAAQAGRVVEEVLDEEPNSPAQRPAPEATLEPQLTPEEKEVNRLEALPYVALRAEIIDEDDTRKRQPKLDQLNKRVYELTRLGILDRVGIKDGIKERARRSTWEKGTPDYFYTQLAAYASSQENEARGTSAYRDNTRYEGLIKDAVSMTATQITVAGLDARRGQVPDFGAYVNEKLSSTRGAERLNELRKTLRAKVLDFTDLELKLLVDTPAPAPTPPAAPAPAPGVAGSRVEDLLQRQVDAAEAQVALLRQGYDGFVQLIGQRGRISPEQFDQALPAWYKELSEDEQGMIRFLAHTSYLAAQKRDTAMVNLDFTNLAGIRFERKDLAYTFDNMPGFRIFLATAMERIFDTSKDHLVISGRPAGKDRTGRRIDATGGYAIISDQNSLDKFKGEVVESLVQYYAPYRERLESKYRLSLEKICEAGVNAGDNFLYALGAYSSGDERRKITPGENNIYSEQERALFMPGIKGDAKWTGTRERSDGTTEEDFGGPMGNYIRYGIQSNEGGFKDRYDRNEVRYIPKRLFYSMLDLTEFNQGPLDGQSLAQGLLRAPKPEVRTGLYDFGRGTIDLRSLKPNELMGSYADIRNSALIPLYQHLTGGDPKLRMDKSRLIGALTKGRNNKLLNPLLRDEQFVAACIAMALAPENGPIPGEQTRMILGIDPRLDYDTEVTNFLADDRLYVGMNSGFKQRLFHLFVARDVSGWSGALGSIFASQSPLAERNKLLQKTRN